MIDIVMSYFNRKEQLINTLKSIESSKCNDFEVTIIDDASDENQRVEDLVSSFRFNIKLIRVESKEKIWIEPLALINKTIRERQSEIIIFQCAECLHVGDIVSFVLKNMKERVHLAFACQRKAGNGIWWDVHSVMHPTAYPFCSAFMKQDYINIGGFDEAFSQGFTCSDDEFLDRVKKYSNIVFIDNPYVFHQDHPSFGEKFPNRDQLMERNRSLLREKRSQEIQKWKKPW
jgi:GT2 family glycosyltransferase